MFFSITTADEPLLEQYARFRNGNFLYLDEGWVKVDNHTGVEFRKGYSTEFELIDIPLDKQYAGNYCIIKEGEIFHDNCRAFPLFYGEQISNLRPSENQQWIAPDITDISDKLDMGDITDMCSAYLADQVSGFRKYNGDFVIPRSGGIDSLTLEAVSGNEATNEERVISDSPLSEYAQQHYWGYRQLASNYPVVGTGYCGDEFLMRNPMYTNWYLRFHGIDLLAEYGKVPGTYMEGFIKHRYAAKIQQDNEVFMDEASLAYHMMSHILNDYQMWHLDDVITFTPFRSNYLAYLMLKMRPEDALAQVTDGKLQKSIINHFNPGLLGTLSPNKNNVLP